MMLPSVLPARAALTDTSTTPEELEACKSHALAKVTNPKETAIFICAFQDCHKLFPTLDRLMAHRKREHAESANDSSNIITWNE